MSPATTTTPSMPMKPPGMPRAWGLSAEGKERDNEIVDLLLTLEQHNNNNILSYIHLATWCTHLQQLSNFQQKQISIQNWNTLWQILYILFKFISKPSEDFQVQLRYITCKSQCKF